MKDTALDMKGVAQSIPEISANVKDMHDILPNLAREVHAIMRFSVWLVVSKEEDRADFDAVDEATINVQHDCARPRVTSTCKRSLYGSKQTCTWLHRSRRYSRQDRRRLFFCGETMYHGVASHGRSREDSSRPRVLPAGQTPAF